MRWNLLFYSCLAVLGLSCKTSPESRVKASDSYRSCLEAPNHEGYGAPFWNEGRQFRKIDENWANTSYSNWCLLGSNVVSNGPELLEHKGQKVFLTGTNIGNVQFIPFRNSPYAHSEAELKAMLRKAFADLKDSGANSFRFWLHIDGSRSPSFGSSRSDGNALVEGLPEGMIEDLQWLVGTAYKEYGLLVNITLWSHDILGVRREHSVSSRDRVLKLFSDDKVLQSYIDKALTPMLRAMQAKIPGSDHSYSDGILSWEVFNEPEGVAEYWRLYWNYQYAMQYGEYDWRRKSLSYLDDRRRSEFAQDRGGDAWTPIHYKGWYFTGTLDPVFNQYMYKDVTDDYPSEWDYLKKAIVDDKTLKTVEIPHTQVLRFINKVAGAIHRFDPEIKVSTGTHSMPYNTDAAMPGLGYLHAPFNYYSDERLIEAGGDAKGTLDFYQVHGYPEWSDASKDQLINMFKNPKATWGLSKPLIVGEHWNIVGSGQEMLQPSHYETLYKNGYAGVWGWGYFYVEEKTDSSGAPIRTIGKHENQDYFRDILRRFAFRKQ